MVAIVLVVAVVPVVSVVSVVTVVPAVAVVAVVLVVVALACEGWHVILNFRMRLGRRKLVAQQCMAHCLFYQG